MPNGLRPRLQTRMSRLAALLDEAVWAVGDELVIPGGKIESVCTLVEFDDGRWWYEFRARQYGNGLVLYSQAELLKLNQAPNGSSDGSAGTPKTPSA